MATTWNTAFEGTPAGSADPAEGDDRIRELKSATRERIEKEHVMDTGSGLYAEDGWHREGSAIAYYESSAPTNRPDGATALDTDDAGRLWVSGTTGKLRYWDGTQWVLVVPKYLMDQDVETDDDVTFNSVTADVTGDLTGNLTGNTTVSGNLTMGSGKFLVGIEGAVINASDENDVFDALYLYITTTGDLMPIHGHYPGASENPYVYAYRTSATVITLYYINSSGTLSSRTCTNGSSAALSTTIVHYKIKS